MSRQHKIAILKYTTKNFWLLLIPLVRGLIAVGFDFYNWFQGAYLDIIVITLIVGMAVARWYFITFEIGDEGIYVNSGVLVRKKCMLPYSAVSCASAKRSMWLRPIKAVTFSIDSDSIPMAGKRSGVDLELTVKLKDYIKIYNKIPNQSTNAKITYRASKSNLIFFSFVFSSTLSGVIFISTFFIQGSKILGNKLEEHFFNAVSGVTVAVQKIIDGVTPVSVALTLIIVLGWGISFISNLLRHINFSIQRCGGNIIVKNGFFSKWKYYINISKVNCADLRQNLLMKICRVMSVHVSCTGYGKSRNEIPVFVPVTTGRRVMSTMEMTLPNFTPCNISVRPKRTYILAYIWAPLTAVLAAPAAAVIAVYFFPLWQSIIKFLLVMAEIPAVYLLIVKITAKFTSGIGLSDSAVTMKYCSGSQFHTVIIPKSRVVYVRLSRSIFQRFNGCCDVWVYSRGERAAKHRIRGIRFDEAEKIVRNFA
ncbi:MAG: PH domain-containing protein [Oscillospiraceae bacterium]